MHVDNSTEATPKTVREDIAKFGGLNPHGLPNWRIVRSELRKVLRGTMEAAPVQHSSLVVVSGGYRLAQKYPCRGWILERWFPATKYGSRESWERTKSVDGVTPVLGPYPERGDYFMLLGPFEEIPRIDDIKMSIAMHIRTEEESPKGYEAMIAAEILEETEEQEANLERVTKDLAHFYESEVEPILKGTSLEASRIRQELAQKMGDWSQAGLL